MLLWGFVLLLLFVFREVGGDECPNVVFRKVQKNFTVENYDKGRLVRGFVPSRVIIGVDFHDLEKRLRSHWCVSRKVRIGRSYTAASQHGR